MGQACTVENDNMPLRPVGGGRGRRRPEEQYFGEGQAGGSSASSSGAGGNWQQPQGQDRHQLGSQDLFDATMVGDARRVKWSLEAHADPNATTEPVRLRPLHLSASQGHVKVAQLLLEYEADLASADNQLGLTPLSLATLTGHREVVNLFVSSSAPLNGPEPDGAAPLLHATGKNLADIAEVLIAAGADVNVARRKSVERERVREALERQNMGRDWKLVVKGTGRHYLEPLKVEGVTPLHVAAWHGNARICSNLLSAGARHASTDILLRSPIMLAAERSQVEVTTLLLEQKVAFGANIDGHSAPTLAARNGHAAVIRLLLDFGGVEVNFVTWAGGPTMLHLAAYHGQGGCVALLCENEADVGLPIDPGGLCPLMLAAGRGHIDICRELLGRGALLNEVDDDGRTAWAHAAAAGHFEVCHLLAGYGASETVQPRRRSTPAPCVAPAAAQLLAPSRGEVARPSVSSAALAPTNFGRRRLSDMSASTAPPALYHRGCAAAAGPQAHSGGYSYAAYAGGADRAAGL